MFLVAILIGLLVYVLIATGVVVIVRKIFSSRSAKNWSSAVLTLVAVLIPTADHVVGYWVFEGHCKEIGDGVKIVRTVENVEGFLDTSRTWSNNVSEMRELGYRYVESQVAPAKYFTFSASAAGQGQKTEVASPKSRYVVSANFPGERLKWAIHRSQVTIVDRESNEIIATKMGISYSGGWVTQFLGGGDYGHCGSGPELGMFEFIAMVLRPIDKTNSTAK